MKYTEVSKDNRLQQLRNTPRMYFLPIDYHSGNNRVDGLIDLCQKYLKPTDKCVEVSDSAILVHAERVEVMTEKLSFNVFWIIIYSFARHAEDAVGNRPAELVREHSLEIVVRF